MGNRKLKEFSYRIRESARHSFAKLLCLHEKPRGKWAKEAGYNSKNSATLASFWDDFINPQKRMRSEGPFLLEMLNRHRCRSIFDACLGTGVDSIYLLKEGFRVTSNEIDPHFLGKAYSNASAAGVQLEVTRLDWRWLADMPEGSFDAVLCMGNSFTHMLGEKDQLRVLRNFHYALRENGILAIDTRNYQYLLDNADEIVGNKGRFRYSGNYVYCGMDKVEITLPKISGALVEFRFRHLPTGKKAYLLAHPFARGELECLLIKSGFKGFEVFSDYKPGYNPEADFFQYVSLKRSIY